MCRSTRLPIYLGGIGRQPVLVPLVVNADVSGPLSALDVGVSIPSPEEYINLSADIDLIDPHGLGCGIGAL